MTHLSLLSLCISLCLSFPPRAAGEATLPPGCAMPTNTGRNFSARTSLEPVCVRQDCLFEQQRSSKGSKHGGDALSLAEDSATLPGREGGSVAMGKLIAGKFDSPEVEDYMASVLAGPIAAGVIFLLLNCCGLCGCGCGRLCCSRKCGCCRPGSTSYGGFARNVPVVFFAFVSALVVVFGIVGLAAGMRPFATSFVRGACFVDSVSLRIGGFADNLIAPIDK
jgi:hypothetical protein